MVNKGQTKYRLCLSLLYFCILCNKNDWLIFCNFVRENIFYKIKMETTNVTVKLTVILFKEDNVYHAYCPALELYGYGDTEEEAKESFSIVISEYLDYTIKENTLETDLKRLGWIQKNKHSPKLTPPDIVESIKKDKNLQRIIRKPITTYNKKIALTT